MKCVNCGKVLKKGTNFCPDCGTRVEEEVAVENIEEVVTNEEKATVTNEENIEESKTENNPVVKKTNRMGLAGFIVALCGLCCWSFVCSVVGLVLSAVAKKNFDANSQKGKGFAIAGLVIGIVALSFIAIERISNFSWGSWFIW